MTQSPILIALIAAIPPTIAAVAALWSSWKNGRKSDAIHVLVNSNMQDMQRQLMTGMEKIAELERVIVELQRP